MAIYSKVHPSVFKEEEHCSICLEDFINDSMKEVIGHDGLHHLHLKCFEEYCEKVGKIVTRCLECRIHLDATQVLDAEFIKKINRGEHVNRTDYFRSLQMVVEFITRYFTPKILGIGGAWAGGQLGIIPALASAALGVAIGKQISKQLEKPLGKLAVKSAHLLSRASGISPQLIVKVQLRSLLILLGASILFFCYRVFQKELQRDNYQEWITPGLIALELILEFFLSGSPERFRSELYYHFLSGAVQGLFLRSFINTLA